MRKIPGNTTRKHSGTSERPAAVAADHLQHLAFDNSLQANIITIVSNGKLIIVNSAACKLLGYSKKELLTQSRATIFDIKENGFKEMLKQRAAEGHSKAMVTAIKKSGKSFRCEITSAVFKDKDGIKKAITTITDMSQSILKQKNIDSKKEKIVANNIVLAKSKQKKIDTRKEKKVADNIVLAKSEQKEIDIKKEKIVADNIVLAKSKQKKIDVKKEKKVADNIVLAKSEQKEIDIKKEKIVADNIVLAKSKQKEIDVKKEKIVADNIVLAKSEQKEIDIKKKRIVADNIVLAKSKQKKIDIKKEKIVADNIVLAKSEQKEIDIKKEKIVANNIILAKSKQKNIDTKKEKIVAQNIILAQAKSDARLAENNEWIRYIAKTSYDVMWDWDIVTGQIYVGASIQEVLGYKVQKNMATFTDFTLCLLPQEKDIVEKKLSKTLASGKKTWNDSFMFKRQDGSVASTTSRASIVRDESGKAIRLIGAIQDIGRLQELEKKLQEQITVQEELSEIFLVAAKLSFDVIWDWNLVTGEMFIGEGYEELFGYTIKNNKGHIAADWSNHLHPNDKKAVEKGLHDIIASSDFHWEYAYRFIRANGSIAKVFNRASIIRHADGTAYRMIGAMQDITRQKELEEKLDYEIASRRKLLTEYEESFKLLFNASSDVFYDFDLIANEVTISDAYEKEFGYKITPHMTPAADWLNHIHPGDKEAVIQEYFRMLASEVTEWKYNYRFLRADESIANVLTRVIVLRNTGGKAYRMIGYMEDMSKEKVLEEKLKQEIRLKEKQIAEATEQAKETERSDLGKELHDNVNQLLGASRMYLEMAKRGGEDSEMYLNRSSQYTLTAIEEIRKLTRGLTTDIITSLGLSAAIEDVVRDTMEVNPIKIVCSLTSFIEYSVSSKFKLNVFRIVQEQLNNILKHAHATEVTINLSQHKQSISLSISDNGVGFDTGQKRKGIGVDNIKSRAMSYDGTADFVSQPGQGCVLTVTFPVTDALLNKN